MSHVATIAVEVNDLEALRAACGRLGLEFRKGQKSYRWYGTHVGDDPLPEGFTADELGKCEHAIALPNNPGAYEVGIVWRDGKFRLLWDFWAGGGGLQAAIGDDGKKLKVAYAIERARIVARQTGHTIREVRRADGSTVLELMKARG